MHGNHTQSSNGTRISNRRRSSGPPPLRSAHRASIHREGSARPTRRAERPRRAAPLPPLSPCGSRARPGSGRGVQDPVRRPDVACINIRPGPAAADRGRGARGGASSRVTARRAGDSASAPTPPPRVTAWGLRPGHAGAVARVVAWLTQLPARCARPAPGVEFSVAVQCAGWAARSVGVAPAPVELVCGTAVSALIGSHAWNARRACRSEK